MEKRKKKGTQESSILDVNRTDPRHGKGEQPIMTFGPAFENDPDGNRESQLIVVSALATELLAANAELVILNEGNEKRLADLTVINTELEAFSYVTSHDLQEPLRKIQSLALRGVELGDQTLSEKGKDCFDRIQSVANRMRQLIDDLLTFSRLTVEERKFEMVDLKVLIEQVKEELKETLDETCLMIDISSGCSVRVIPFQFRQILHNLINNAIKFSKSGQPLSIVIKARMVKASDVKHADLLPETTYCHISVADNGIGFDPRDKERIFQVFEKLHTRAAYGGSGIGLAIVKRIVTNHSGVINATSSPNEGATFNIYLPT